MLHRLATTALIAFGFSLLVGCSGPARDEAHGLDGWEDGVGGDDGAGGSGDGSCIDGDVQECRIDLGEHNGVKSCIDGLRTCVDGAWSECEGDLTS
jgi:hypothetical protein